MIIAGDLNVVRKEIDIKMASGGNLDKRSMPGCRQKERENI